MPITTEGNTVASRQQSTLVAERQLRMPHSAPDNWQCRSSKCLLHNDPDSCPSDGSSTGDSEDWLQRHAECLENHLTGRMILGVTSQQPVSAHVTVQSSMPLNALPALLGAEFGQSAEAVQAVPLSPQHGNDHMPVDLVLQAHPYQTQPPAPPAAVGFVGQLAGQASQLSAVLAAVQQQCMPDGDWPANQMFDGGDVHDDSGLPVRQQVSGHEFDCVSGSFANSQQTRHMSQFAADVATETLDREGLGATIQALSLGALRARLLRAGAEAGVSLSSLSSPSSFEQPAGGGLGSSSSAGNSPGLYTGNAETGHHPEPSEWQQQQQQHEHQQHAYNTAELDWSQWHDDNQGGYSLASPDVQPSLASVDSHVYCGSTLRRAASDPGIDWQRKCSFAPAASTPQNCRAGGAAGNAAGDGDDYVCSAAGGLLPLPVIPPAIFRGSWSAPASPRSTSLGRVSLTGTALVHAGGNVLSPQGGVHDAVDDGTLSSVGFLLTAALATANGLQDELESAVLAVDGLLSRYPCDGYEDVAEYSGHMITWRQQGDQHEAVADRDNVCLAQLGDAAQSSATEPVGCSPTVVQEPQE